ncbi:MAG: hypothetical protein BGO21_21845 [Dyadobacter sp. 50-39]|uniref:hypothetical protein n=1 Tax=Dyadobacter sp. 50-39 TaxID=1895756 RepID=UPI00095B872A|nr:hypothetical protein [Dyadobacter sp. 50-39]OJV19708.1 MAG: hypothetical protein BGO21_21845 [Dyadobacter sp. 50-39]
MKTTLVSILCLVLVQSCIAQDFLEIQKKLNATAKRRIRKELIRSLTHNNWMTRPEAYALKTTVKIIPVLSFTITPKAIEYDSTKKIIQYIQPNENFPFEFAIFSKKNKFQATLNCFNIIYYSDCGPCNYNDFIEEKDRDYNYEIQVFFNTIQVKKCSLLFTVQFFRNAIWFIQSNNIMIYSIENRSIYSPDEFISKHCSIKTIRDLSQGKLNSFCN